MPFVTSDSRPVCQSTKRVLAVGPSSHCRLLIGRLLRRIVNDQSQITNGKCRLPIGRLLRRIANRKSQITNRKWGA
jgi:hypothetical protein